MDTTQLAIDGTLDSALRDRAKRVVPGGMYGHLSVNRLPADYPQFWVRGQGARTWTVDGREYVDMMCSWGPILLGHCDPVVEAAAQEASRAGDVFNGPTPVMVELAERLVDTVAHADWAMFAKNGNDVTMLGLTIARAATGRSKVLMARGSYHGIAGWSLGPDATGTTPADHANTLFFEYNDLASVEAAATLAGDVAAIVVTPIRHDVFRDLELPDPEFARGVRALCDRIGAALIIDDVRCGLRLDPRGSWEALGVRPDLSAWSKSLANGHPIAALMGADSMRDAATRVTATGSFWMAGAPMAAALATLDQLEEFDGVDAMRAAGERFRAGLLDQAASHGLAVTVSGPPQLPFMSFAGAAARNGTYLHPVHNWFISVAHDNQAIDQALDGTDRAFAAVREAFGEN